MSWDVNRKWHSHIRMRVEVGAMIVSEMLEAYRQTLTVREESELLGAPPERRMRRLRQVVPKLINAYLEVELNRTVHRVSGVYFNLSTMHRGY